MLFSRYLSEKHKAKPRKNRRLVADRRCGLDRRAEVRFEPDKADRRQRNRRRGDSDPWQAASREH